MSDPIKCWSCGHQWELNDGERGKSFACEKCGAIIVASSAESADIDEYALAPLEQAAPQPLAPDQPPTQEQPHTQEQPVVQEKPVEQEYLLAHDEPHAELEPLAPQSATFENTATGGKTTTCFKCSAKLPANAVLCTSCGMNLKTGRQLSTKSSGADDQVYISLSFGARCVLACLALFFGFVASGAFFVWEAMAEGRYVTLAITVVSACLVLVLTSLAIRNSKHVSIVNGEGGKQLVLAKCFGLFTFRRRLDLKNYDSVWFIQQPSNMGTTTILFAIATALLFVGVLPGLMFWYILLNSDDTSVVYRAELRGPNAKRFVIHRGLESSKHDANGLVFMIHSATGLRKEEEIGLID